MRYAYRVAAVRAAEAELMRTVAEPELMTIAAAGLARIAAGTLAGGIAGARVVALVGSGNNGGDAPGIEDEPALLGQEPSPPAAPVR